MRSKREVPEISGGAMADIAFMLLIFFLVATTMDVDSGLTRMLPPPIPPDVEPPPPIKERNVFVVLLNKDDRLLVENEPMKIEDLKQKTKEFIENPNDLENLPEKKMKEIPFFGNVLVSKGVISLQNDRSTSYGAYLEVQDALVAAYNELKDELAKRKFGKPFDELTDDKQKAIREFYPQAISEAEPKNIGGN